MTTYARNLTEGGGTPAPPPPPPDDQYNPDCGCLLSIHPDPHWVYSDRLWKEKNDRMRGEGNLRGYIVSEQARLGEKLYQMRCHGVTQVPQEGAR